MAWTLIYIISFAPLERDAVGYFPSYQLCHAEAVWQAQEGFFGDRWACVLLPKPTSQRGE